MKASKLDKALMNFKNKSGYFDFLEAVENGNFSTTALGGIITCIPKKGKE